jgi:phospholipase A-2-activating protein
VGKLNGHDGGVNCLIELKNGCVASGSDDESVCIWKGEECVQTIKGHVGFVYCLLQLSNEELLSGGEDATIKKWDVSGECVATFTHHS